MPDDTENAFTPTPEKVTNIQHLRPKRPRRSLRARKKSTQQNETYQVGYKKPPADKRFQEGQSGNPRGRPKGSKNKPKLKEGVYHFQMALASGIISVKAPPKPKPSMQEKFFRKRSSEGFPRKEHCSFDDYMKIVTISGPMNKQDDEKWQVLIRKEYDLMGDLIWQLEAIIDAPDDYIKREMQSAADFTKSLLSDVRDQKEKFTRRMNYKEFEDLIKASQK
mgnify:CR=1 FL=1